MSLCPRNHGRSSGACGRPSCGGQRGTWTSGHGGHGGQPSWEQHGAHGGTWSGGTWSGVHGTWSGGQNGSWTCGSGSWTCGHAWPHGSESGGTWSVWWSGSGNAWLHDDGGCSWNEPCSWRTCGRSWSGSESESGCGLSSAPGEGKDYIDYPDISWRGLCIIRTYSWYAIGLYMRQSTYPIKGLVAHESASPPTATKQHVEDDTRR